MLLYLVTFNKYIVNITSHSMDLSGTKNVLIKKFVSDEFENVRVHESAQFSLIQGTRPCIHFRLSINTLMNLPIMEIFRIHDILKMS